MKRTKTALLHSAIALLLCISMLIGSTFAWFSDGISSGNNIIQSGNLDIEMYWTDDLDSGEWFNVEDDGHNTVFNYDNWEPGYTDVKYIKLVNNGSLAMNYKLTLTPQGAVGKLAEVINVYFADSAVAMDDRDDLSNLRAIGLLNGVLNGGATASGTLLPAGKVGLHPAGETIMTIAMSMINTAGNDYQNETSGEFTITALATQAPYEQDSFGSDYDTNAEYPVELVADKATAAVTPVDGKVPTGGVTLTGANITAVVPEGAVMASGADRLTLSVTPMEHTTSDIKVVNDEILIPVDVHIDGLAEDNTVPVIIRLGEVLPKYLNMGNYHLFHVEDGTPNEMTLVDSEAQLIQHNQFTYDPLTGEVTVAMATFSEVALVADTSKAWKGKEDYTWYNTTDTKLYIANADQLHAFAKIVGGMAADHKIDSFSGKTVTLLSDINLNNGTVLPDEGNATKTIFYPIGYNNNKSFTSSNEVNRPTDVQTNVTSDVSAFEGTFDGNGHTIANFYQNTWEMFGDYNSGYPANSNYYKDAMGLFGYVHGGTVKNLTVDNFESDGEFTPTGVIAAYADGNSTFENIAITNCNPRVYNTGNGGIVGIAGDTSAANDDHITLKNITVDNSNKISALWGSYDVACGGLVGMYRGNVDGNGNATDDTISFENCHVSAIIDVYNDVCGNYQYYAYRYAGMIIGSVRHNTKNTDGKTIPNMTGISATGCTVNYGTWNDYYYCEFEKNSIASYSEDYQFSRVPHSELNFTDSNGNGKIDTVEERNSVSGCKHTHTAEEDKTAVYLPFHQLFTGYSWGVSSIGLEKYSGIATNLDITEGNQQESVDKFVAKDDAPNTYRPGYTYTIGDLFQEIAGAKVNIVGSAVYVSISPATENDSVSGTYEPNSDDWTKGTITIDKDSKGSAKIIITDYYFCNVAVLTMDCEQAAEKFTANTVGAQNAYTQITLGTLFGVKDGTTIGNVTATVTDPNGTETTVIGTTDWTAKTIDLTKDGTWTVAIKDDDAYCSVTTATFTVNKVDKFTKKFDKDFLYRVGNKNAVAVGNLFGEIETTVKISSVDVTVTNVAGNAAGTFTPNATWTNGEVQFSGTGVVNVTISADGANELSLKLEVVDATNVTSASFGGNVVLLKDVSTTTTLSASGVVYGNGFTVNMENAPISEKNGAVFHLYDGAVLKNLGIIGKEFSTVAMNVNDTNYGVSAVRAWGTVTIENCYISGCRSAVSATGTELTIKDSVIANGVYANVDFRSGILNLHNVTTINEPHSVNGTTILGLGIVGNMTASAGRNINITGTLTQYNWVSQADCKNIKASGVDKIYNSVFTDSKYQDLRYTYNGTTYVNTGILSLCSDFGSNAVTGVPANYDGMDVTATISNVSVDGYVWAPARAGTLTAADMAYHDEIYQWTPSDQGTSYIPPAFDFASAGLKTENGVVQVNYESGSSCTLSADTLKTLLTPQKYGQALPYTISKNGEIVEGDIVFDAITSQSYTITYTITDNLVYDKKGLLTTTIYPITKDLKVFATVVDKGADAPTFTFYYGTNGSASAETPHTSQLTNNYTSTIKQVGEAYYIMPNVSATTANAIGSQTVDGETIYYPIVDGINVRSGNSTDYDFTRYYPIFKAVKISDNGTEYSYSGTTEMPDTVAWVEATIDDGNGASALNDGFGLYNNQHLCKIQKKAGDAESGGTSVVKYSYTALDGNTYYYYVGYRFYDEDEGGVCVTPDTLVTLADGSQMRIDALTGKEELLVWNHETGKLDNAPVAYIVDHEGRVEEREIIHLTFANGRTVKIIGEHVFFDATQNKYVAIDTNNADAIIGHTFVALNASGTGVEKVKLVSVERLLEETISYEVVSYKHLTCFTEGILSTSAYLDPLLNVFDVNVDSLAYSTESVQKDIETYGLYTYADFDGLISEEAFELYNAQYLKIAVGKGYITWNDILDLIDIYFNVDIQPLP